MTNQTKNTIAWIAGIAVVASIGTVAAIKLKKNGFFDRMMNPPSANTSDLPTATSMKACGDPNAVNSGKMEECICKPGYQRYSGIAGWTNCMPISSNYILLNGSRPFWLNGPSIFL